MQQLRVGILGLGAFGESHIRAYIGLPYVDVAAVASRSGARAQEIATHYGIETAYDSHEALIADDSIDAISVTTAEHEHLGPVVAALQAGKHVLVEKPIASTSEDAQRMLEVAQASSGILMPGHVLRFAPPYAEMKATADRGDLGRLVSISARRNRPASLIESHGRVHPALITAIHDVDIMCWIAGAEVVSVRAIDRVASRHDGAHGLWGLIEFENGVVGTVETVWQLPSASELASDDAMHVIGTSGIAKTQFDPAPLRITTETGSAAPDLMYEPMVHGAVRGALGTELAHFAQCALSGTQPTIVTPEDGARALRVVLALVEAAERGETIQL